MLSTMAFFILFLLGIISNGATFKPVVLMHGILSGPEKMEVLVEEIQKAHPDTKIYNFDKYDGWASLENSWRQVIEFRNFLEVIGKEHPGGINVVGYSQGGLIARTAIQTLPSHNINTFISLSSPQAGQFGANFLHLVFPDLAANTAYELFYSTIGQHISIANYWNDPSEQELYYKFSKFLPLMNNEIRTYNSSQYKNALLRLNKMILIGGPNDGVITPWESSHFGYFNKTLNVIPLHKRLIYINDSIGLKSLDNNGKLIIVIKPFVHHLTWHTNRRVIQEVIIPYLD
ncbi:lysosomal thioesterase PPT2 homolog [Zeugodacus cucurbitae]|uniref:lysosomal thioesterase PPT2 homolog n=1 Tax=Zeugodacus cucurbitae TaxID=28588 RepID=UPI0005969D72|nr:lysosomal thioesterase PPT2 homolog [Zeugodacus cucurbitae]XP_054083596.1 lysosomal thioesterase PPT2 homolog [Zeugodacus cucurbitae]XP_054083597.1 lysosomal thioesterase PPT2 homolog [Zeugodacus cucurbitae]XP_054083598.1 lysosomal thioesterase PPT2 homolog [Zeugodacus cucurbitae]